MSPAKTVLIHFDEARAGKTRGLSPNEYLAERFKIEHGMSFEADDFLDNVRFGYWHSDCGEYYKVTYLGDVN